MLGPESDSGPEKESENQVLSAEQLMRLQNVHGKYGFKFKAYILIPCSVNFLKFLYIVSMLISGLWLCILWLGKILTLGKAVKHKTEFSILVLQLFCKSKITSKQRIKIDSH